MKQILISNIDPNWPKIEVEFDKPVKLYMDGWLDAAPSSERKDFKILYLREPDDVSGIAETAIRFQKNHNFFDVILTTNQKVLNECSNAHLLEFGTSWIFDYTFPKKKFQISALVGHKEMTEGHRLRKKLYYKQNKINNPIDFYISKHGGVENAFGNKILDDKKEPLFDSQFHICIENTMQEYFFSEKVMDCFRTKTIPIFWGTPKIGKYFDVSGMIIVNDLNEIINACNSINENTYESMLEYAEHNFKESDKYMDIPGRMKKILDKILYEKSQSQTVNNK